jgi:hypothetical protein
MTMNGAPTVFARTTGKLTTGYGAIAFCLAAWLVAAAEAEPLHFEPWRIVSAADWHSAEGGVTSTDPAAFATNQVKEHALIKGTVFCAPDVVLIAGDVGSGHWTTGALKKAGVLEPNETIEQAIHRLGALTYRTMKENFSEAGIDRLFLCVGDHGIGDNDWAPGSERSRCVPFHREIFGRSFNTDRQGKWLWPETVCGVPSRPVETKYENTSFAVQHKNVLFVMVDVFYQEGPDDRLHPRHGSVNPDLAGPHLAWFENVLAAARDDERVRYVFVQGHTPALPPVRAQSSSMMMADDFDRSNLWLAMRNHGVDLYFAGEVHATTVSKDPKSDLVQIVTDRNLPTMITVYDDKLELQCYDRRLAPDGTVKKNPRYDEHMLTVDKTGPEMVLREGKGFLKPLDRNALFIHCPFEVIEPTPFGSERSRPTTIRNHGELGGTYDVRTWDTTAAEGKLGSGLQLEKSGVVDVHGTGPFGLFDRTERTLAIWLKTTSQGKHNIICGGSGLKAKHPGRTGAMDLGVENGRLFVRTSAGEIPASHKAINDGKWHHVALVVMPNARTLGDIQVYADGEPRPWAAGVDPTQKVETMMGIYGISLGGSHRPVWAKSKRKPGTVSLPGAIDDFAAWYRALSENEIRQLYELGSSRSLDASRVDEQFRNDLQ